jgi:hypothetical protein
MTCDVEGCDRPVREWVWCHGHYESWRRTGEEPTRPFLDTPEKRFWAKVNKDGPIPVARPELGPCWLWTASTDGRGRYGSFQYEGRLQRAHHVAYRFLVGPIPEGQEWDHLCRVTLCVRPLHGEWVSHRENVLRGESLQAQNARKTHCHRGHEFTSLNTLIRKGGGRVCLACQELNRERRAEQQRRRRAALTPDQLEEHRRREAEAARRYRARYRRGAA